MFPPAIWEEKGGRWKLANSTWKFLDHARIVFLKRDFWNQDLKNLGFWGGEVSPELWGFHGASPC